LQSELSSGSNKEVMQQYFHTPGERSKKRETKERGQEENRN
jgi:hypothetical protein